MLDIQLADGLSFEIFKEVEIASHIIFTTAYDEYAIKAFDLNSIGYLLKPIQKEKLQKSLEKFYKTKQEESRVSSSELLSILGNFNKNYKKRFLVNAGEKIRTILTSDISYFYSMEKSTFLCSKEDRHYLLEYPLDKLEEMVNPEEFFRINRQYLVHISSLSKIVILGKSRIRVDIHPSPPTNEEIFVSNAKASSFRKWLDDMK
jgi:two-component system response regulator LytT